jgi:amino-acid N-acetyltransferase
MLSALELLHYCRRFQDTLFTFFFKSPAQCAAVLMDLRVLFAARIQQVIFCAADSSLAQSLAGWNRSGDRFSIFEVESKQLLSAEFLNRIRADLVAGNAPFIAITDLPDGAKDRQAVESDVISAAVALGAEKVFFPGSAPGLQVNGKCRSYPSMQELREAIESGAELNIPAERLRFLADQQELHSIDLVLVEARRGSIYEEVFTHAGSGTLFTREYPNILRQANEKDVRDIMALMHPYIAEGTLKAISEDDLLALIPAFTVYSVNSQIIAAAALVDYGDSCELAKLCTLPRFQARGRARALVRAVLDRAKVSGKRSVFALTVQPYVGEFFERLGFTSVDRESLPHEWKAAYDFTRQSRAYLYTFR